MNKSMNCFCIVAATLGMLGLTAANSACGQTAFMEPAIDANATFNNTGITPDWDDYMGSEVTVGAYWDYSTGQWVAEQLIMNDYGFPSGQLSGIVYIGGVAFAQTAVGSPGFSLITTVYGDNLDGASGGFLLGGVNAASPDFTDPGENIVGLSNTVYQSYSGQSLTFSQMQAAFPDFDFSNPLFDQSGTAAMPADDGSLYYVFQTLVPTDDLNVSVPEPATVTSALVCVGILALRRQKRPARAAA